MNWMMMVDTGLGRRDTCSYLQMLGVRQLPQLGW